MKCVYRVVWYDPYKNIQQYIDVDQNLVLFISKKRFNEGMQDVVIHLIPESKASQDDGSIPVIDID